MDPDVALCEMRGLAAACLPPGADADQAGQADRAAALPALRSDLDDWICRGGYLPDPWRRAQRPAAR